MRFFCTHRERHRTHQLCRSSGTAMCIFPTDLPLTESYGIPTSVLFYPENFSKLDETIRLIQQEYLSRLPYFQERCRILMEELFIFFSRSVDQKAEAAEHEMPELRKEFERLRLRMLSGCEEEWTVERLCRESVFQEPVFLLLTKDFLRRVRKQSFFRHGWKRPGPFLPTKLCQIQQAARQCGFSNMQHFSRYFKACYHCSPRAYRENLRKNEAERK